MENVIYDLKVQLIEHLNLEGRTPENIDSDEPIFGDGLGLDSIDALEIIVLLENHYGLSIETADELTPHLKSVRTLAEYISEKTNPAV